MRESACPRETITMHGFGIGFFRSNARGRLRAITAVLGLLFFMVLLSAGCSNLTGWRIPGTEKGAGATTTVYLVLENVETIPEDVRPTGKIFVDGAFFGNTSNPMYYRFVGNELVVGTIQLQKEKIHEIKVALPGYEPFVCARYFGTLPEYSVAFSLKRTGGAPEAVPAPPTEATQAQEKK
jgi:hypothetical protein